MTIIKPKQYSILHMYLKTIIIWLPFTLLISNCKSCSSSRQNSHNSLLQNPTPSVPIYNTKRSILQESREIANDLSIPLEISSKYIELKLKTEAQAERNTHSDFVGIEGMKDSLRNISGNGHGNLNKFIEWAKNSNWEQFGPNYHHYDWWIFPIDRSSQGQGFKYTVYKNDIQQLKTDFDWLKDYRLCAILLMQSWGWDVKNKRIYSSLAEGQAWRHWDVRLGKMAHSLILFEQWDLYENLKTYVQYLIKSNIKLETWVLKYFEL